MEWLVVTRCPCRLVSMSSGSTYAEKYARYVEFRLSFSTLRFFPEALFFAVDRNVRGSAARASTDLLHDRGVSFSSLFLSSLYNVASSLHRCISPFSFLPRGRTEKSDMCQATVDPWHARWKPWLMDPGQNLWLFAGGAKRKRRERRTFFPFFAGQKWDKKLRHLSDPVDDKSIISRFNSLPRPQMLPGCLLGLLHDLFGAGCICKLNVGRKFTYLQYSRDRNWRKGMEV